MFRRGERRGRIARFPPIDAREPNGAGPVGEAAPDDQKAIVAERNDARLPRLALRHVQPEREVVGVHAARDANGSAPFAVLGPDGEGAILLAQGQNGLAVEGKFAGEPRDLVRLPDSVAQEARLRAVRAVENFVVGDDGGLGGENLGRHARASVPRRRGQRDDLARPVGIDGDARGADAEVRPLARLPDDERDPARGGNAGEIGVGLPVGIREDGRAKERAGGVGGGMENAAATVAQFRPDEMGRLSVEGEGEVARGAPRRDRNRGRSGVPDEIDAPTQPDPGGVALLNAPCDGDAHGSARGDARPRSGEVP